MPCGHSHGPGGEHPGGGRYVDGPRLQGQAAAGAVGPPDDPQLPLQIVTQEVLFPHTSRSRELRVLARR